MTSLRKVCSSLIASAGTAESVFIPCVREQELDENAFLNPRCLFRPPRVSTHLGCSAQYASVDEVANLAAGHSENITEYSFVILRRDMGDAAWREAMLRQTN